LPKEDAEIMKENAPQQIDPVCGMNVEPNSIDWSYAWQGQTYYFCAEGCLHTFKANPAKFSSARGPRPKGWWSRYLKRLNKATGGKPPRCCG